MALVWQKTVGNRNYQVRRAGASIRLYTNGVFHSQYNPRHPLGGNIWDLLVLPALFAPEKIQRILILGLGGGAAIRALQKLLPDRHVTAIEIDPVHLYVAKRFFDIKPNKNTRLIKADAIHWLRQYRGEKFDFILDDLFIETNGMPDRATNTDANWSQLLIDTLAAEGTLAINFDSPDSLKRSALIQNKKLAKPFKSRYSLSTPGYDNRIAALSKSAVSRQQLNRNLQALAQTLDPNLPRRLRTRVRGL